MPALIIVSPGFPFSFGIFEKYYSNQEQFSAGHSKIATIGTLATGIMYLGSPFMFAALQQFPNHKRSASVVGLAIIAIALVASSFSTTVTHLILTQGILYAIGGTMLYTPTILFLEEWFVKRRGLGEFLILLLARWWSALMADPVQ